MQNISYKRITKSEARKRFDQGQEIFLQSSKMPYNSMWQKPMPIQKDIDAAKAREEHHKWCIAEGYKPEDEYFVPEFDLVLNEFIYYNCDRERGNGVHFLIVNN